MLFISSQYRFIVLNIYLISRKYKDVTIIISFIYSEECRSIIVYIHNSHLKHKEATAFVQHRTIKQNHLEIR